MHVITDNKEVNVEQVVKQYIQYDLTCAYVT